MKDKVIKGLIRVTCLSIFYLIFEHISRNWGLAETRQFLYSTHNNNSYQNKNARTDQIRA